MDRFTVVLISLSRLLTDDVVRMSCFLIGMIWHLNPVSGRCNYGCRLLSVQWFRLLISCYQSCCYLLCLFARNCVHLTTIIGGKMLLKLYYKWFLPSARYSWLQDRNQTNGTTLMSSICVYVCVFLTLCPECYRCTRCSKSNMQVKLFLFYLWTNFCFLLAAALKSDMLSGHNDADVLSSWNNGISGSEQNGSLIMFIVNMLT